jgi:hypothetical protein
MLKASVKAKEDPPPAAAKAPADGAAAAPAAAAPAAAAAAQDAADGEAPKAGFNSGKPTGAAPNVPPKDSGKSVN